MDTNHEMNYYNYGKTLSAEGIVKSWLLSNKGNDNHEYVDLGLQSGTLWAKHNIQDADGNELYFAWGGTQGYTAEQVGNEEGKRAFSSSWEDYEFGNPPSRYNGTDGKAILDTSDDAAYVNWGSEWRMPTKEQFDELTANTTSAWTQVDGVNGLLCTSTANGNTLFFPAVGDAESGEVGNVGVIGYYWSVSLNDGGVYYAWKLYFNDRKCVVSNDYRFYGLSVRPVRL